MARGLRIGSAEPVTTFYIRCSLLRDRRLTATGFHLLPAQKRLLAQMVTAHLDSAQSAQRKNGYRFILRFIIGFPIATGCPIVTSAPATPFLSSMQRKLAQF